MRLTTARACGGPVGTGEGGKRGRSVYRSWDILIHAVMDGALLLLQKGCIRYAWHLEELSATFTVQRSFHNYTTLYTSKLTTIWRLHTADMIDLA